MSVRSASVRSETAATIVKLGVPIVAATAAGSFGLSDVFAALHEQWTHLYGPFEHGYLVLGMGLWIAVTQWRERPVLEFAPSGLALVLLSACVSALAVMELLFVDSSRLILLPVIFLSTVWAALGASAARRLWWGAMFIYFALPQWWIINGALQDVTIAAASTILHWAGVPAHIEGNIVYIPAGAFEIANGCSGLNYLMAGTALASFFALTRLDGAKERAILIGVAAIGSILLNWLRVFLVVLIGHLSDMQNYLVRVEHHTFGWALFLVFLGPLIVYTLRVEGGYAVAREGPLEPKSVGTEHRLRVSPASVWMTVPIALLLMIPRMLSTQDHGFVEQKMAALPAVLGDARREAAVETSWSPAFVNADQEMVEYVRDSRRVVIFRASYFNQDRGHRLIEGSNDIFGPSFKPVSASTVVLDFASKDLEVSEYRGSLEGRDHLLWYWYEVGGSTAHSSLGAKFAELLGRIRGRRDGSVIALLAPCTPDCGAARDYLKGFVGAAYDELQPVSEAD